MMPCATRPFRPSARIAAPLSATDARSVIPSSLASQEMPFTIDYVVGSVSGEIYWERMEVGGRVVPYQAMGASACCQVISVKAF